MMKKIYILGITCMALSLGACDYNDKNFGDLDELIRPTNAVKEKYTLLEADYATIGDNKTNQKIAEDAGVKKALEAIKNNLYLTPEITGATYIPAFLSAKYFTADPGSSVKVTYRYKENKSSLLAAYSAVRLMEADNKAYQAVYGSSEFAPYLDTEHNSTDLLTVGYENPEEGDVVLVDYKYNEADNSTLADPLMWENFEGLANGKLATLKDWMSEKDWLVTSEGGADWNITSYDGNRYVQYSANKAGGVCEAWMVTPAITLEGNEKLSFDVCVGYWKGDCLSVWISEDFDGKDIKAANWKDITASFSIPNKPAKGYGVMASAGEYDLAEYSGKKVYIAFKYLGDDGTEKKTTTYQLDNIMIGSEIPGKGKSEAKTVFDLKVYGSNGWGRVDKKVVLLSAEDYEAMDLNQYCFSEKAPAVGYLPNYLAKTVAYPLDGDIRLVVYRYNNGKEVKVYTDEYFYSAETARWALNDRIIEKTEQFVYNNGKWNFDPSTVITLVADKTNAEATAFYTAIVDWVKANHSEFVTSYGNNEYYYGSSFYQNNFDFRLSGWKKYYDGKSDEEIEKIMWERLPEALTRALEKLYADADVVPGVEVTYTVNFSIYDGLNTKLYTIQFLVTGKAKFEYVEDSLQEVKE